MHVLSLLTLGSLLAPAYGSTYVTPPYSPPPNVTGTGWDTAFEKAKAFLEQLTLEEKANLTTGSSGPCVGNIPGVPRLGFPGLCLQDGPTGVRAVDFVSVFPAGLSAAATWNRDLIQERGRLMGKEYKEKGIHIALGPCASPLGRNALSGRNWEGFSPDPYLTGVAFGLTIEGMQTGGVQACAKHYIGNEQETERSTISSNMDDRTMHELYEWPFANAVKAGVASIMCSYNKLNTTYACENDKTLNGLLKDELGFQGYVMSDWGGTHSGVKAIMAGLDMNMPGGIGFTDYSSSYFGGNITQAVNNGSLPLSRVDDMILRIMTPYYFLGQDDYPKIDPSILKMNANDPPSNDNVGGEKSRDVRHDHAKLIREMGAASSVLLQNKNGLLPIKKLPQYIGIFGNDAGEVGNGFYLSSGTSIFAATGEEMGTQICGGGSGAGRPTYLVTPLEAIRAWAEPEGSFVQYVTINDIAIAQGASLYPVPELCFVFLKTYATEGVDRTSYDVDWNGTAVVDSVTKFCKDTVVITHSAGVNDMTWADNENVTAIIAAHLPGTESGNSIVDILSGAVNPSGKLPYTVAYNTSDFIPVTNISSTNPDDWQADFTEGLFIDYRHFDDKDITPRYEFGFGLSYTTFELSGLSVSKKNSSVSSYPKEAERSPGGNPALYDVIASVTFTVTNSGSVQGNVVPQLYVSFPSDSTPEGTPLQVLRGFDNIPLEASEGQSVTLDLTRRDLSFWDTEVQNWKLPKGGFEVRVGLSSRDIKATAILSI